MTAPTAAEAPSKNDLTTWIIAAIIVLTGVGMFVLTEQHEPVPGWLEAGFFAGLAGLGLYKAASPGQNAAVAQVAGTVATLADKVDLNHLDTMQQLAAPQPDVSLSASGLSMGHGGSTEPDRYISREAPEWTAGEPSSLLTRPEPMRVTRLDETGTPVGASFPMRDGQGNVVQQQPDALLDELHAAATAAAPSPVLASNAPPIAR